MGQIPDQCSLLHSNEETSNKHHTCPKQSTSDLSVSKEPPCPQDREYCAQLKDGGDLSNQTKRNGGEANERSNPCNEYCKR